MAYPTVAFTVFFTFALLFMHVARRWVSRETTWIILGCIFYGSVHAWLALFLLGYAALTAWAGHAMERKKSAWLAGTFVAVAIGFLAVTKYMNWGLEWFGLPPLWPAWAVPASLSFITFQAIWAVLQSYRGEVGHVPFYSRMAHICFFPSLSAGPIVALSQWQQAPTQGENLVHEGLSRIALGLFQKLVLASIANTLASTGLQDPSIASTPLLWQSILAYTFEIYFDFAGYSNMAIGVALLMGMRLPENFHAPYLATNIQDFWRRWHISLSTFFRDNLYIGVFGGNRNGLFRQMRNALLIMLVCGLWHGANATYLVWGLLHGVAIALVVLWKRKGCRIPAWLGVFLTFVFVTYAWIWFRAPSLQEAMRIQQGLWAYSTGETQLSWGWPFLVACFLWLTVEPIFQRTLIRFSQSPSRFKTCVWAWMFIGSLALSPRGMPSFIYYQF